MEFKIIKKLHQDRQNNNQDDGFINNAVLILCIVTICLTICLFLYMSLRDDKRSFKDSVPLLVLNDSPSVIYAQENTNGTVTLSGVIMDEENSCVLKINGEIIETANKGDSVDWSANFDIPSGESKEFNIELVNSNGVISGETRTVQCQKTSEEESDTNALMAGCEFVKKKSGGLNIRQYAGTDYDVIDFIEKYDYYSKMIYLGETAMDYEGYIWYHIIAPNGNYGYVRSDLVTIAY